MSRSIDPQRPRSLNQRQLAKVNRHPEVVLARRVRDRSAKSIRTRHGTISHSKGTVAHEGYRQAHRAYLRSKRDARKSMIKFARAKYGERQPVVDILQQLKGGSTQPSRPTKQSEAEKTLSSERRRALMALLTFASPEPMQDHSRRSDAINAVRALCHRQETTARQACRQRASCDDDIPDSGSPATSEAKDEGSEHDRFPIRCQPTQCIFCVGDEELSFSQRNKRFCNRDGLKRHFLRKHVQHHSAGQRIRCPHPRCRGQWLEHMDHLRNHAATVHGTVT